MIAAAAIDRLVYQNTILEHRLLSCRLGLYRQRIEEGMAREQQHGTGTLVVISGREVGIKQGRKQKDSPLVTPIPRAARLACGSVVEQQAQW
jgi:hypothetical protein